MFRAVLEFLFTIVIILVARAVLTSLFKGIAKASSNSSDTSAKQSHPRGPSSSPGGELHKDPVCGTYVPDSTPFRRQASGQLFYYCSETCREKHALVAR